MGAYSFTANMAIQTCQFSQTTLVALHTCINKEKGDSNVYNINREAQKTGPQTTLSQNGNISLVDRSAKNSFTITVHSKVSNKDIDTH